MDESPHYVPVIEEPEEFPVTLPSQADADGGCGTLLPRTGRKRELYNENDPDFPTNTSFQQDRATVTSLLTSFVHEAETVRPCILLSVYIRVLGSPRRVLFITIGRPNAQRDRPSSSARALWSIVLRHWQLALDSC